MRQRDLSGTGGSRTDPIRGDATFCGDGHAYSITNPQLSQLGGGQPALERLPPARWRHRHRHLSEVRHDLGQQIVSLLVFQSPEPRPIGDIAPWFDRRELEDTPELIMRRLDQQTHRRFIKSHVPFDGMPIYDGVKYIHVARDGRDACLSYHNHCRSFTERNLARFDALALTDEALGTPYPRAPENPRDFFLRWMSEGLNGEPDGMPFGSWFNHERTWWAERHRSNVLMVHYRDLKADLSGEMQRVAAFLDIPVPAELWPTLVEAATFANMRRNANTLHPVIARAMIGGAETFFHKGENDRWRGVLTDGDMAAYEARVGERFEPECAAWLQAGRLGLPG